MIIQGNKIIWKVRVGSHAYGTNIEGSDEDIKGIYIQSPENVLEYGYLPQIEVSKDEVYFELKRFVELVVGGNPTMLEILFAPQDTILYANYELMIPLLNHKELLLSKQLRWSFGGYAIDQIKKASGLDKKMNWEDERKVRKNVLDFCYINDLSLGNYSEPLNTWLKKNNLTQYQVGLAALDHFRYTYSVYLDFDNEFGYKGVVQYTNESNDVSLSSIPLGQPRVAILQFNKDGYSVHCKEYGEYETWLKERNTQRYIDVEGHGQRIDGKNMLHCVRLLDVATEIAEGKGLNVRRENKDYLISIRKGKVPLEELLENSKKKISDLDELFNKSGLPDKANPEIFQEIVKNIRKKHYSQKN